MRYGRVGVIWWGWRKMWGNREEFGFFHRGQAPPGWATPLFDFQHIGPVEFRWWRNEPYE